MIRRLFLIASVVVLTTATAQADRFTVDGIGTSTTPVRIMKKGTIRTTLHDAGGTVTYTQGKKAKDGNGVQAVWGSAFSGGSASVDVSFGKVGAFTSTLDLGASAKAALLLPPKTNKTATAAANMAYNVSVLEARKYKVTNAKIAFGNVLKGAKISTSYNIETKNKDASVATNIAISGTSSTAVGQLSVAPLTIAGTATKSALALTGYLTDYGLKTKVTKQAVAVTSAEAGSVGDATTYKALSLGYTANVGIAAKYGKSTTDMTSFTGTVLNASVAAGEKVADATWNSSAVSFNHSLSSKVAKNETTGLGLALDTTAAAGVAKVDAKGKSGKMKLYGLVGSEASILAASGVEAVDTTISMTWRARTLNEAYGVKRTSALPTNISDGAVKWLTSDVVKVGGLSSNNVYALQMTFDNRINLALDGPTAGTLEKEWQGMFVAQMSSDNKWERTSKATASTGHMQSLESFLKENAGKSLSELEGAWGVDVAGAKADARQRGNSWAIVRGGGSGVFAVVPEPATVVMMLSAVLGALAYGWRRLSRKS